jgi:hypothetical protein
MTGNTAASPGVVPTMRHDFWPKHGEPTKNRGPYCGVLIYGYNCGKTRNSRVHTKPAKEKP